ncbi:hypothetical protein [Neobacillus sp. YIM B06451]|uniref:hypothetical protein n=1 Tax=Neobacillus sp. YIM B06451 TaxID=3070994 RepID=UPI00292EDB73|nr:hypothetical protein [Neobacillus sp. YIM B06451]
MKKVWVLGIALVMGLTACSSDDTQVTKGKTKTKDIKWSIEENSNLTEFEKKKLAAQEIMVDQMVGKWSNEEEYYVIKKAEDRVVQFTKQQKASTGEPFHFNMEVKDSKDNELKLYLWDDELGEDSYLRISQENGVLTISQGEGRSFLEDPNTRQFKKATKEMAEWNKEALDTSKKFSAYFNDLEGSYQAIDEVVYFLVDNGTAANGKPTIKVFNSVDKSYFIIEVDDFTETYFHGIVTMYKLNNRYFGQEFTFTITDKEKAQMKIGEIVFDNLIMIERRN